MMKWAHNPGLRPEELRTDHLPLPIDNLEDVCSIKFELPSIEVAPVQDSTNTLTLKKQKKKVKRSMTMTMPEMIKTGRRNSVSLVKSLGVNIDNIR